MTICRNQRPEDPFARIDKFLINDPSLSWKAKGILSYAFSKPDTWKFFQKEIQQHASDGPDSLRTGLEELEKAKYLHRRQVNNPKTGKFEYEWYWFTRPISDEDFQKSYPDRENPDAVNPSTVKSNPSNNDTFGSKNDLKEFVADDPVGSPPYKISVKENNNSERTITRDDLFKYAITHPEWKVEEINYAWEVLASYQGIVYDWQRFIEGTVEKYRNQLKSKRASGEKVFKGSTHKSQNRGKGQCNQTIPTELKNINSNSSENDSGEQASQERISITEALRRLEAGSKSPETSLS